jgi:hypothetical protein
LSHTHIPTFDDLPDANAKLEWLSAIDRTVKLFAIVNQRARVVHRQRVALFSESFAIACREGLPCWIEKLPTKKDIQ